MARTKPELLDRARSLRRQEPAAEQLLWERLRSRRLRDIKFVRQLAVESFIADFACREHHLIVEVDGATHSTAEEIAYDRRRDDVLIHAGWNVLRVSNHDVLTSMDGVLEAILRHCGGA
jgi:very-short-patch-repair endonuclease